MLCFSMCNYHCPTPGATDFRDLASKNQMMCYFVKLVNNNNKVFNRRPCSYYSVSFSLLLRSSVSTEDPIVILRFLFKVFRFEWKTLLLFYSFSLLFYCFFFRISIIFIPHAASCGGYNVSDSSISQSVSPVFLVSATPLKPLNRIL